METQERILKAISDIKKDCPYLRIGQIIVNALPSNFNTDAFYISDEELADCLEKLFDKLAIAENERMETRMTGESFGRIPK